ncbi:hypothetical protein A2U01_0031158, partial [Trifolium medium]|nr:hypothetical protein [Trifolium medium]
MQIEGWLAESSSSYVGEGSHRRDNLEELCLSGFMNPEIVYSFLHRNPNLKSLTLDSCTFTYIVPLKMPSKHENLGVVPKLKILKLIDLYDLETIGFEQDILLERIEFLILKYCTRLVNIIPSHVSLTHLTDLEVDSCDSLEKLMPPSAAKSLVQLNTMKVMNCESLLEIVDNEEDKAEKIVFSQLKVLELVSLKNLNCFSKSDKIFEFPSLEKLV